MIYKSCVRKYLNVSIKRKTGGELNCLTSEASLFFILFIYFFKNKTLIWIDKCTMNNYFGDRAEMELFSILE